MFNKLKVAVFNAVSGVGDIEQAAQLGITEKGQESEKPLKFKYKRPFFLSFTSDEEVQVSADHHSRPIIVPRDTSRLPWHSGYAEAVNAGKSHWNEDQAYIERRELVRPPSRDLPKQFVSSSESNEMTLPYIYFALFDGHAGSGASVAATHQLHHILHEKLNDIIDNLLPKPDIAVETTRRGGVALWIPDRDVKKELLIKGALELAFHDMDEKIKEDKKKYRMKGGCTALVALFILGKLYIANAGDSRAVLSKDRTAIAMSHDFTPESERNRVRTLAAYRPEFLGNDFTRLDYARRPTIHDLGKRILYRDYFMTGWAYKIVTREDLKYPVVIGEGKRSRVLATIGVTRGFGDHDLKSSVADINVKPFLSSQPEVKIFDISEESVTEWDVLIMGTDGLWDTTSNSQAVETVHRNLVHFHDDQRAKYTSAAQDLVMQSRGKLVGESWRTNDGRNGSVDDISVFVIPLLPYKEEYTEWKTMFDAERGICEPDSHKTFGKLALRSSPTQSPKPSTSSHTTPVHVQHTLKQRKSNKGRDRGDKGQHEWQTYDDSDDDCISEDRRPNDDVGVQVTEPWLSLSHQVNFLHIKTPESSPTASPSKKPQKVAPVSQSFPPSPAKRVTRAKIDSKRSPSQRSREIVYSTSPPGSVGRKPLDLSIFTVPEVSETSLGEARPSTETMKTDGDSAYAQPSTSRARHDTDESSTASSTSTYFSA